MAAVLQQRRREPDHRLGEAHYTAKTVGGTTVYDLTCSTTS